MVDDVEDEDWAEDEDICFECENPVDDCTCDDEEEEDE